MSEPVQFMVTVCGLASHVPTTFWISAASERNAFNRARQLLGEPCELLEMVPVARQSQSAPRRTLPRMEGLTP